MAIGVQPKPELWAGIECTINRVGDQYFSQLERNGHLTRIEDLALFASLGIRKIRYPVLWEQMAPSATGKINWSWADERLYRLKELGICPIVGFVHHGSGPRHTSLIDPDFPCKLADYAQAFAERYPWITYFTPVNEPLTTARFSGLYGHWYPHGRSNEYFIKALAIQCKAIALCMKVIRSRVAGAQLVQTEDICKTASTPLLAYQADFENERRWMSLDMLCGAVNESHALWPRLCNAGTNVPILQWLWENPCPPDIMGFNHYRTSNRFLDEDLAGYPSHYHGGNGTHRYADIEAVAVETVQSTGIYSLLKEAWQRYHLPLAITEVHLCSGREAQLRWFKEFWDAAVLLCSEQIPVKAVTAWALLGSFDWNSLVTQYNGFYESGVFDLRGPQPRPTAVARLLTQVANDREPDHPVLAQGPPHCSGRPVLITGAAGLLGGTFAELCKLRCIPFRALSNGDWDMADASTIAYAIKQYNPWAIINAAGYVQADQADEDGTGPVEVYINRFVLLAQACKDADIRLVNFSSDLVFDGNAKTPYVESSGVCPVDRYGRSKAEIEKQVLKTYPQSLIIRTGSLFGSRGGDHFIHTVLQSLKEGKTIRAANDIRISPTFVNDLAGTCLDLLIDEDSGIRHLTNEGDVTWADFARLAATTAQLDASLIIDHSSPIPDAHNLHRQYSVLSSERGILMPALTDAMTRYCNDWKSLNQKSNDGN